MAAKTMETLRHALRHPDPAQLRGQLFEIVHSRAYLQHGIEVGDGDIVLDVGANVGVAAAFFATECRAGVVHSFEPVAPIFAQLRENLEHFPACVPHNYGLAGISRTASITFYPRVWAMSSMYADPAADRSALRTALRNAGATGDVDQATEELFTPSVLPCELRTVSEVLHSEGIQAVDLLKIDVEKAELDVLAGISDEDWPSIRQIVAEVHLDAARRAGLEGTLRDRDYDVTVVQDPIMRGTPVRMLYAVRH